ncbi:MAG TPA: SUMF1/EgtB/PvdO family nonheme iron enzyme [Pyrinomonadaceae bacterium]|nr:SUMF1/EgtB/PvdO family nonheme iron enzyme [Pyrinomonadaceae bacterium]
MPHAASQLPRIFISYRRDDCAGHAGRLFDRLAVYFGDEQIFMDLEQLEPGVDFLEVIEEAIGSCEILIALIGRGWLTSRDDSGRRLDNPNDFVRLEIAAAFARGVRVIPVLVQGAQMPRPQDLPEDLSPLSRRHALELSDLRWRHDVDRLIRTIEKAFAARGGREPGSTRAPANVEETPSVTGSEVTPARAAMGEPGRRPQITRPVALMTAAGLMLLAVAVTLTVWRMQPADNEAPRAEGAPSVTGPTPSGQATAQGDARRRLPDAGGPQAPPGMAYVPGGEFAMGRDDGDAYERPAHTVAVPPFFMDIYEVTCEEYEKFIHDTGRHARGAQKTGICLPGAGLARA